MTGVGPDHLRSARLRRSICAEAIVKLLGLVRAVRDWDQRGHEVGLMLGSRSFEVRVCYLWIHRIANVTSGQSSGFLAGQQTV